MAKYIFVTGGVVSSLGKGITAASIGRLLVNRGFCVNMKKFDPYINVDPGTMSPYQHGEVFVTEDGGETDLDLGHYERFTGCHTSKEDNITTGQVYGSILSKERKGDFLGQTIQVIPHITDEIKHRIKRQPKGADPDFTIVEIGGTVGDIESLPFLEAIRQCKTEMEENSVMYIHVTLVPYLKAADEMKTKPTQHSVKELRSIGTQPDVIVCRTERSLNEEIKSKIALFCSIKEEQVIENKDLDCVYEVPAVLADQGLDDLILAKLSMPSPLPAWEEWNDIFVRQQESKQEVSVAVVGKYSNLKDAYSSVNEAIFHGGLQAKVKVAIKWVQSEDLEKGDPAEILSQADAVVVPGGFGSRGIEGKIKAAHFARTNQVPYLGLCLGMQIAVVEFARHAVGLKKANSTEFDPDTPHPVIHLLPGQKKVEEKGGTMRLGVYPCRLHENSRAAKLYGKKIIEERHRHRFELNNHYRQKLEEKGLQASGIYEEEDLVEIVEVKDHPFYIGTQFHPEFLSKPTDPHPLFAGLAAAALKRKNG